MARGGAEIPERVSGVDLDDELLGALLTAVGWKNVSKVQLTSFSVLELKSPEYNAPESRASHGRTYSARRTEWAVEEMKLKMTLSPTSAVRFAGSKVLSLPPTVTVCVAAAAEEVDVPVAAVAVDWATANAAPAMTRADVVKCMMMVIGNAL